MFRCIFFNLIGSKTTRANHSSSTLKHLQKFQSHGHRTQSISLRYQELMASTTSSNQYTFQRASTMATRSLVSDSKPSETPSASSNDVDATQKPTLQRKTTNHYEQAAAGATTAGQPPAATATDRPTVDRQQSWKRSDLKGQQQGQMLSNVAEGQGYSTTQK